MIFTTTSVWDDDSVCTYCTKEKFLEEFLEMYDNWYSDAVINDDELQPIIKGPPSYILSCGDIGGKEVVSFGFYDDQLYIRVK